MADQTVDGYQNIPDELKRLHCEELADGSHCVAHLRNFIASLSAPPLVAAN